MPELPEVQTVVNDLNEKIKGDVIVGFWSDWPKTIKDKKLAVFKKEIVGRKILLARRLGKNIFIDLSGGKTLYIHLKMTGHLLVKSEILNSKSETNYKTQNIKSKTTDYFSDRVNQYIHHIWKLKSGRTLEFSDVRKFAKIVLDSTEKINNLKEIKALGVDALSSEFTFKKFQTILDKKPKGMIGVVIMDQQIISGIGNIYRSEILFDAGVLPERKIESLSETEKRSVYSSIEKILKKAVKLRGTSDSDYRDTSGAPGQNQKVLKVYRKEKQECRKCGTIVIRKTLGQRSVFFCPECQK